MTVLYCTNCFNFFNKNESKCPICNSYIDKNYNQLIQYAHETILYGYLYRDYYEKQLQKNNATMFKAKLISPDNLLNVFGLGVLTSIVANASYDLIKSSINKILKTTPKEKINKRLQDILTNEIEFKKFIKYISDYYNDKELPEIITTSINEEKMTDLLSKKISKAYKENINKKQPLILKEIIKSTFHQTKDKENNESIKKVLKKLKK